MARLRCIPATNTFSGVSATGSGITAPAAGDWSVSDGQGVTGDILDIDILAETTPRTAPQGGYLLQYYEAAIEDQNGDVEIIELPWGPWANKKRRIRCATASNPQRVRIRAVQQLANMFEIGNIDSRLILQGDEVLQPATGSSAKVVEVRNGKWMVMTDVVGPFASGIQDITIGGIAAKQATWLQPTQYEDLTVELRSEWSDPVEVTPSVGSPTAVISANKTTCLQGEAVLLQVETNGFDVLMDTQELHFEWSVDKAGEQGSFEVLTNSAWESDYGAGQNRRHQGFSRVWAFAPKTIGNDIDVTITVRDRSGNVATDTLTLTSVDPLDEAGGGFAGADIYAVSVTSRAVPGAPSANIYTDYDNLVSALPSSGEGLILLDTAGAPGTAGTTINADGKIPDRFVIMPYNENGVGVAAGAKAEIRFGIRTNSNSFAGYGLKMNGPYDPTDPYSIAAPITTGLRTIASTGSSLVNCEIRGWEYCWEPGPAPATIALFDSIIADFRNYGIYQPDPGDHAFAGLIGHQHPESWKETAAVQKKGESTPPFTVDHVPWRSSRRKGNAGYSKCSFLSVAGWTNPSQPCFRMFGGANSYPYISHMSESRMEQRAGLIFGTTSATADNFDGPQDVVIDKLMFYGSDATRFQLALNVAPFTLRNVRFVFPDHKPTSIGAGARSMIMLAKGGGSMMPQWRTLHQPVVIENVTAVSRISSTYFTGAGYNTSDTCEFAYQAPETKWTKVTVRNNLFSLADQTAVGDLAETTGPFDETPKYTPIFQAEYDWDDNAGGNTDPTAKLAWNLDPTNGRIETSVANLPIMTATFEPQSGSSAYQTASGSTPYDDILSRVRPTNGMASKGAYDPGAT